VAGSEGANFTPPSLDNESAEGILLRALAQGKWRGRRTMKRWIGGIAVWLCACSLHAQEARTWVTLDADGSSLHARYRLPAPAASFALAEFNAPQRQDTWTPADPDWTFDGTTVSRKDGAAFSAFALELHPDLRFLDRRYMAVERIGADGWSVLLDALRARDGVTDVRFETLADYVVRMDGRTLTAPTLTTRVGDDARRAVYLGPRRHITPGAMTLIAGEEIPEWLRAKLSTQVSAVVDALKLRFGGVLLVAPTLIVTYEREWPGGGFKGSTLNNSVISLSLRGMSLRQDDAAFTDELVNTVTHEVVHFWNGGLWETTRNFEEPWLHEGAAEYLASRLDQSAELLRAEAERRINACVDRADRRPLGGAQGPVQGQVPYNCGFVMQLVAESASLRNGQGDIFSLWRELFAAAEDGRYSPQGFIEEATRRGGDSFAAAANLLMGDFTSVGAAAIASALAGTGLAASAIDAETDDIRGQAVQSFLATVCTGQRGFVAEADHLQLDTGDRCGTALANDPAIVSVNGVDLMADALGAHAVIRATCAEGGTIVFGTPGGGSLAPVPCDAVIAPVRQLIVLESLPAFPR
jgi:hypothetical protein